MTTYTNKIEQMEAQLEQLKRELEEYKNVAQEGCVKPQISVPPALLPLHGEYYLDAVFSWEGASCCTTATKEDQNIFPDKETAQAYGEAFSVMLELRRQPGSCAFDDSKEQFVVDVDGDVITDCWRGSFTVSPLFTSMYWANKAIETVGKERIVQAYNILKGELYEHHQPNS